MSVPGEGGIMAKETQKKSSLKDKATGDFKKFNEETLKVIDDTEKGIGLTKCESIEEFKEMLFSDDD